MEKKELKKLFREILELKGEWNVDTGKAKTKMDLIEPLDIIYLAKDKYNIDL